MPRRPAIVPPLRLMPVAMLCVGVLTLAGCGGGTEVASPPTSDPVCDAMVEVAGVWTTQAPERLLGEEAALGAFAAGLQGGFDRAIAALIDNAPANIDTDLETVQDALTQIYVDALAFAAGDSTAVPAQTDTQRAALGRVDDWARQRCPDTRW